MIDSHCHLENQDYDKDREGLIENCRKEMDAIITCCANPKNLDLSLQLVEKYRGFVFLTAGLHPIHIEEFSEEEKENYFAKLEENKEKIVGIGECGLDYHWIKNEKLREKQKQFFLDHIKLAKRLKLPLVIHSRKAEKECLEILKEQNAKNVLLHFFSNQKLREEVATTNYYVSLNTAILRSKGVRQILKTLGTGRIMTETDAPWMGFGERNTPLAVKKVIEKTAQLEKKTFEEIDRTTTNNAIKFFNL